MEGAPGMLLCFPAMEGPNTPGVTEPSEAREEPMPSQQPPLTQPRAGPGCRPREWGHFGNASLPFSQAASTEPCPDRRIVGK